MAKKAFFISAIILLVIIIICVIISVANMKPLEFKSTVSYDNNNAMITAAPKHEPRGSTSSDIPLLSNLINYEKTIVFSTIFIGLIFVILLNGTKKSRG